MTGPRRSSRQNTPTASEGAKNPRSPSSTRRGVTPSKSASTKDSGTLQAPSGSGRKSTSSRGASPRTSSASKKQERPTLPTNHANKQFKDYAGKTHKVKLQTLNLGGKGAPTITIARVKCPVPKGVHGHLIKRFDTDAVSASTLYRAAFPTATESQEAAEMAWLAKTKKYGDTKQAGAEDDESRKLSGTWVPTKFASALAEDYGISKFATDLIAFKHEPESEQVEVADSEAESPVQTRAKSPRLAAKRARLASPLASHIPLDATSGASAHGVSITQTLTTDPKTGVQQETTEVHVAVPASSGSDAPQFAANAEEELKQSRKLVEQLKKSGTLAELKDATDIPQAQTLKRSLEDDEADEDALPTSGSLADQAEPVDSRGFFGKLFRRAPRRRVQAPREINKLGSARSAQAAAARTEINPEGRRWAAGLGLVVAVGATAAAPFFLG